MKRKQENSKPSENKQQHPPKKTRFNELTTNL